MAGRGLQHTGLHRSPCDSALHVHSLAGAAAAAAAAHPQSAIPPCMLWRQMSLIWMLQWGKSKA